MAASPPAASAPSSSPALALSPLKRCRGRVSVFHVAAYVGAHLARSCPGPEEAADAFNRFTHEFVTMDRRWTDVTLMIGPDVTHELYVDVRGPSIPHESGDVTKAVHARSQREIIAGRSRLVVPRLTAFGSAPDDRLAPVEFLVTLALWLGFLGASGRRRGLRLLSIMEVIDHDTWEALRCDVSSWQKLLAQDVADDLVMTHLVAMVTDWHLHTDNAGRVLATALERILSHEDLFPEALTLMHVLSLTSPGAAVRLAASKNAGPRRSLLTTLVTAFPGFGVLDEGIVTLHTDVGRWMQ